ncbi:hypothetical protein [Aquisalinus flavus]|uniref:Uncharacterized protein n=1 Tax=Aquisalinus flavus TaxID=1526572 RepID=A0A8J2V3Z8_9PROT|nr:hypothetical protein [Aquisalinus flavus]MBD0425276.1 hypothetical protein [Aquisalinus flavus]UNE49071.1 hypothetical protein FF099_13915 [Aquisalinus flavus]GGD17328.1 hypothetical protein GCM10011342_27690 [Aquisalinus flavus]
MALRLITLLLLVSGLSACASALPNGAAPVSSLYSYSDTARFMLGDICLASVVEGVPVSTKTNVPGVYPVEGTSNAWRSGPGGAVRVTQLAPDTCEVSVTRGIRSDIRSALMREVESAKPDFRLVDSVQVSAAVTDTYCAPFPSGLSVMLRSADSDPDRSVISVTARAGIRRDLCL